MLETRPAPPVCQSCGVEGCRDNCLIELDSGGLMCLACANRPAL